jgi:hypothetical protein
MPDLHVGIILTPDIFEEEDKKIIDSNVQALSTIFREMPWAGCTVTLLEPDEDNEEKDEDEDDILMNDSVVRSPKELAALEELKKILPENAVVFFGETSPSYLHLASPTLVHESKAPLMVEGSLVSPFAVADEPFDIESDNFSKGDNKKFRKELVDGLRNLSEYAFLPNPPLPLLPLSLPNPPTVVG